MATANLVIMTAEELMATDSLERQAVRRAARRQPLAQLILRTFLDRGGPIPVEDVAAETVSDALAALDEEDLIRLRAGRIDIAYPFSAAPTPFHLRLSDGRERFACCAVDALGIAPMTGEAIEIRSRCHHCGDPLEFSATPQGPGPGADGVMVWFGKRGDDRRKVADSL
jgi:hypothetical protein